jgi:hypothetical protein
MRILAPLPAMLCLLAMAPPMALRAQFQAPTDEELKMTADPKAPGAAAVYLNVEEIADDKMHFQSFYARIKVLQEKGKELATVEVPYFHNGSEITDIKARTIHADGTVIPLVGKPEDLLISKSGGEEIDRKVFNLPSVEVGSILEYRFERCYDDHQYSSPFWEIQRPYFVHKAHYAFTPFKGFLEGSENATSRYLIDERGNTANTLIWRSVLPKGATMKSDSIGRFSLDVTDIPSLPDEEWMPPVENFRYKVQFYYKSAVGSADYWVSESKRWSKEVNHFAEPSAPIRAAVNGLLAPGDCDLDKARKLYLAVQALDNTDFSRKKDAAELKQLKLKAAKRAEDTWAQKSGSSEDIALLYLAMARAAGLTANAMKVVDRQKGIFDSGYLSFDQLDDTLVILKIGGKEIELDPGEKMCPFQTVHWRHSGASGFIERGNGKNAQTTPGQPYTSNKTTRFGDLTLDQQGGVQGSLRFVITGQEALYWRQLALGNDEEEVKKQFDRQLEKNIPEGVEAHVDHFLGMDDPSVNLVVMIKAQGTLGTVTSKRLLLPGFFFETRGRLPFVAQEKRQEFVDMHYGEIVTDQITYHLPAGMTVEGAPAEAKISWPQQAVLLTKTVPAPGQIVVARSLARAFTFAKPEEYQEMRGFYQKIATTDQQQLVLAASAATKGL